MDASDQAAVTPKQGRAAAALMAVLFTLPALFLFCLMTLALGTFLPPVGSVANLSVSFMISALLTTLFNYLILGKTGPKPGAPGRGTRGRGLALGALGLLAIICYVVLTVVHAHWHNQADMARRGLTLKGFPMSLAELQENLPDSQYAYPALVKAVENDFDPAFYNKITHAAGGTAAWTAETARTEAEYAAHYAPYLEKQLAPLLKQKYPRYMKMNYAQVSQDPLKAPFPKLGNITAIAKAAKLCAIWRAREGNTEKAWELVRLQFSLAGILANEKALLSKMVTLAVRGQGVEAAAGILLNRPGAAIPRDIIPLLTEASDGNLAGEGLKAELAYQNDLYNFMHRVDFRRFRELGGISGILLSTLDDTGGAGLRMEYLAFSLLLRLGVIDLNSLAAAGYFSTIAEPGPWAQVSERSRQAETRVNNLPSWPFILAKFSLPSFSSLQKREFEVQARARLTLACGELLRYRREHGKYPKRLSEVNSKEISPDVFSGGEFSYKPAAGGGFDLCSSGPAGDSKDISGKDLCIRQRS